MAKAKKAAPKKAAPKKTGKTRGRTPMDQWSQERWKQYYMAHPEQLDQGHNKDRLRYFKAVIAEGSTSKLEAGKAKPTSPEVAPDAKKSVHFKGAAKVKSAARVDLTLVANLIINGINNAKSAELFCLVFKAKNATWQKFVAKNCGFGSEITDKQIQIFIKNKLLGKK